VSLSTLTIAHLAKIYVICLKKCDFHYAINSAINVMFHGPGTSLRLNAINQNLDSEKTQHNCCILLGRWELITLWSKLLD
jgi:hypothetical protein